jgi:hypothetical protein
MSFINSVLNKQFQVPSQYDLAIISSNQCSWCAYEFSSAQKLFYPYIIKYLSTGDEKELRSIYSIYEKCLYRGSEMRKSHGIIPYGENTTNKELQKKYDNIVIVNGAYCIENSDKYFLIDDGYENEFMNKNGLIETNRQQLYDIFTKWITNGSNRVILANRYGQSFAILQVTGKLVLICDSHCKYFGLTTIDNAFKYLMFDQTHGDDGKCDKGYKFCSILLGLVR